MHCNLSEDIEHLEDIGRLGGADHRSAQGSQRPANHCAKAKLQ